MSGTTIDKKISSSMKKVGKLIGWEFKHYRPDTYITPLQTRNYLATLNLAYSQDDSFKKGTEDPLSYFKLFCEYGTVRPGDLLRNQAQDRTFIVFINTPLRGPVGVTATHLVNILRPVYNLTGDKKTVFEQVATDLPIALQNIGAVADNGSAPAATKMATTQTRLEIWTWTPSDLIRNNDVIEIDTARYIVQTVAHTPNGTTVRALSTKVGK
jgi:hypothetical protein